MQGVNSVLTIAEDLKVYTSNLDFKGSDYCVYHPLDYAWEVHQVYIERYAIPRKRRVFVGINPGPFGMAQTGIPFGEVNAVRDFLKLSGSIKTPRIVHPKRPVLGFDCKRSEVSGKRLWGLFESRFHTAEAFFKDHYVVNYCPLLFLNASGCNVTPEKLPHDKTNPLFKACDVHLTQLVHLLGCEWVIAVGSLMHERCLKIFKNSSVKIGSILHPSPASPQANRLPWGEQATQQLIQLGVWC